MKNAHNSAPWVFLTFFKVHKWYQVAQRIKYISILKCIYVNLVLKFLNILKLVSRHQHFFFNPLVDTRHYKVNPPPDFPLFAGFTTILFRMITGPQWQKKESWGLLWLQLFFACASSICCKRIYLCLWFYLYWVIWINILITFLNTYSCREGNKEKQTTIHDCNNSKHK